MTIFVVLWTVLQFVLVPCVPPGPHIDEYGIEQHNDVINAVACHKIKETAMRKEFTTREAAEKFIEDGKKKSDENIYPQARLKGWEIREEVK